MTKLPQLKKFGAAKVRFSFVFLLSLFSLSETYAQEKYDLATCISLAEKNSLLIQQALLSEKSQLIQVRNAEMARYPNLNSNVSNSYNFGRTIDPFSNSFLNSSITALSLGVSSNVRIFKGFQFTSQMAAARTEALRSQAEVARVRNDVILNTTALYLQILLAEEQIKATSSIVEASDNELRRVSALFKAGSVAKNRLYELETQLAADKSRKVMAENTLQMAYMSLRNFLNLSIELDFEIEEVSLEELENLYQDADLTQTITEAYNFLPEIESLSLGLEAAEYRIKASEAERYPTISLGANLNTLYSSQSRIPENPRNVNVPIGIVPSTGEIVNTQVVQYDYVTPNITNQFNNNFGQTIGINMSIPIFNRNLISSEIANAEINYEIQEIQLQAGKNEVRNQIFEAYTSMNTSYNTYLANEEQLKSQRLLFEQTQSRFDAGVIGYFDHFQVRNMLTNIEIETLRSKYDFFFKQKVFEFYLGKPIALKP